MANIFSKIADEGRVDNVKAGTREARDWFRDRAMEVTNVSEKSLMNDASAKFTSGIYNSDIGRMYMFFYDPKHKKTLPHYDTFPLIFVIERYPDGFLGMNLHYLPLMHRARLMDALYKIEEDDKGFKSKRIGASYALLKKASQFPYFAPTVHRYLFPHVRSRYMYIPYEHWDTALFLPLERFKKQSKQQVWNTSKKKR